MDLENKKTNINELYKDLKKGAETEIEKRERRIDEEWEAYRQENIRQAEERQEALNKLGEAFIKDAEQKEAARLEELKTKKMLELEEELEKKEGIPSQKTRSVNNALSDMLAKMF